MQEKRLSLRAWAAVWVVSLVAGLVAPPPPVVNVNFGVAFWLMTAIVLCTVQRMALGCIFPPLGALAIWWTSHLMPSYAGVFEALAWPLGAWFCLLLGSGSVSLAALVLNVCGWVAATCMMGSTQQWSVEETAFFGVVGLVWLAVCAPLTGWLRSKDPRQKTLTAGNRLATLTGGAVISFGLLALTALFVYAVLESYFDFHF